MICNEKSFDEYVKSFAFLAIATIFLLIYSRGLISSDRSSATYNENSCDFDIHQISFRLRIS
ncbi:MAG: hypothetical protein RM338_16760 [Nostoc sp. DedQUE12a]|nr:hypothetical protein [Nostoc sp. DedQUE12a]